VRRVVALALAKLVYARVAARAVGVARCEGVEDFGRQGGLEKEGGGFLPGWVRAAFTQRDDLWLCMHVCAMLVRVR
jgi:hypothetical protein